MNILFYFSDYNANIVRREKNKWGGVGYYRTIKPSQLVKGHTVKVMGVDLVKKNETPEERWYKVFQEHDVFWTSYFSDPKEASALFYTRDMFNRKGQKKKVVLDCDDNYLDILPSNPLYDKLKPTKRDKAFISTILSFADVVTVSTEPLKQRFRKHFKEVYNIEKPIFVIPNMNDIREWDYPLAEKDKKKFVIGYAASHSHQDDLRMFFPHLHRIMQKHKHVHFESIGTIGKNDLGLFADFSADELGRCDILPHSWTFDEFPKMMSELKWDVGVAPLVDSPFARCKTHNKWMEYSSINLPTIASRVYPYFMSSAGRKTIEHDKTGLLVKPSEWYDALESLILNESKRISLGQNAYEALKTNWQYRDADDVSKTIDKILNY